MKATGHRSFASTVLWPLAAACHGAGDDVRALTHLSEMAEFMDGYGERYFEPEVWLLRADILLDGVNTEGAEAAMLEAVAAARRQQSRLWELHAATVLARLWQGQGRRGEARELLQPAHDWFTEGLDTAPLVTARALLAELG